MSETPRFADIPSLDRLLNAAPVEPLVDRHGRGLVADVLRECISDLRARLATPDAPGFDVEAGHDGLPPSPLAKTLVEDLATRLEALTAPSLKPVFNLTGTVLHTNLGRAPLPDEALAAIQATAGASNLEFELATGRRGDRDAHVEAWLCRLTGAEAATVVNNNAAAVLLVLNTLARNRQVCVSRGELIEIGGSFRMPEIMARAGCKLVEVGTTNRTHLRDYADAIERRTAALMKVHTSNYVVQGFTASVAERELVALARASDIHYIHDLGSGSFIDVRRLGLPSEPTPMDAIANGAEVVTFSGDKLLGGPQCGIVVGDAGVVARIKRNPMKRALRVGKLTLAALGAVLPMYADPERVCRRVPTLRALTRPAAEIEVAARRVLEPLQARLGGDARVEIVACESQVGSGALPLAALESTGIAIRPPPGRRSLPRWLKNVANAFRGLPRPVVGRIHDDALLLDIRCLEDETGFIGQLDELSLGG